ncbi:MAG: dephospho-CoA kinase [Bdellovibrionales bacterium]|nr:dephospho-CoA kinase [Bdellovibrionales bacterium]
MKKERHKIHKIGLTGGIAAGKSFAAEILRREGIAVIDMDALGKEITDESPTIIREISKIVGKNVADGGRLDRQGVREAIFADARIKRDLENLLHPMIRREFEDRCDELEEEGKRLVVCEAALLVESGHYKTLEGLIVVTAPLQMRKERLIKRDGISEKLANQMIEAQISDEERLAHATYHVRNDGDTTHLYEQIKTIVDSWREADWL